MLTANILLILIGTLGAIDIAWFHTIKGRLVMRPESRKEAWIHVIRGFGYAAQFLVLPNVRFEGLWNLALLALFAVDVAVAVADVLEEPASRASAGGLSGGEYLMHVVLSVLVGAMLHAVGGEVSTTWTLPTALEGRPELPGALKLLMACMAVGAAGVSVVEALVLVGRALPPPPPIHVRVRLDAPLAAVWNLTQDHRLHPAWDHRFSRIEMTHEGEGGRFDGPPGTPDPRIGGGTVMTYEKRLGPVVIRGFGRYKAHRPMRQSTFEFWSDDARSLIRRGVGLWLYTPLTPGRTEFATSYTYDVRWGPIGRVIDTYLFRPIFQRYTEASFRRLARRWFSDPRPVVLGRAEGRRPATFDGVPA